MSYCLLVPFINNALHEFERINELEPWLIFFLVNCYLAMRLALYVFLDGPGRIIKVYCDGHKKYKYYSVSSTVNNFILHVLTCI